MIKNRFMLRALVVALAVLASACGPATKCRDLCSANMPCQDTRFVCIQSKCLMDNGDAGPPSCPSM